MEAAAALNDIGRAPAKPSSADYYALEPDEAFYDEPAQASSNPINNTETRPEATREPSSSTSPAPFPAPQDHQSSVPASSSSSSKRPHQDVHLDLELEDEAELDALAAQTAAPAKKPRLAQDLRGPYESDHPFQSGLDSYATANINLGTSRNALAPVQAKTFDGQPITLTRRLPQMMQSSASSAATAFSKLNSTLIATPLWKLKEEIVEQHRLQQQETDAAMAQAIALSQSNVDAMEQGGHGQAAGQSKGELWVDRYRPQKFADLLGDDRVHRDAMAWLKEWDPCVFKTGLSQNSKKKKKHAAAQAASGCSGQAPSDEPPDPHGRPTEKVLLLAGPPGLGKTTLAQVLAKQAGYQVHEINASDDRSARVVTDRIKNATESRAISVTGTMSSNRPTCVLIDEIDGASGGADTGFVKTLVKFVQDGSKVHRGRSSKNQKKEQKPLLRPIICICNDLYAPVLRPLRPLARLVRFSPVPGNALVGRMRKICDAEKLPADTKSLNALVSSADGDLRTCLNTLQFLKTRKVQVSEAAVRDNTVGAKDTGTSAAAVWHKLFKRAYDRKGKTEVDQSKYVDRLVKDLSTCGEYDKIVQGCFEYYPAAKWPVDGWHTINNAFDWLHFYDLLDKNMRSERNYEVIPYLPYSQVPWHPLFAAVSNKPIEWPRTDYEAYQKKVAHQEVADAFTTKLSPLVKGSFNSGTLVTELQPYLNRIISPDVKMAGNAVTKPEERVIFDKLIRIMSQFGLSFVQDKNEDGQWSFKLEPPIDVFVHYDGKRASDIAASKYSLRQLVASTMASQGSPADVADSSVKNIIDAYKQTHETAKPKAEAAAVDFFGRPKEVTLSQKHAKQGSSTDLEKPAAKVVYRYREGFSNAVRTPIKMNELFQTESSR